MLEYLQLSAGASSLSNSSFHILRSQVYACGNNEYGQLGLGSDTDHNTFTQVPLAGLDGNVIGVSCGASHSFLLTSTRQVYACGYNVHGQLGLGNTADLNTFTKVPLAGLDGNAISVSCAASHSFLLTSTGQVY